LQHVETLLGNGSYTHTAEEHVMYAVTSRNNRRDIASGVLCGSTLRLYDSTNQVQSSELVSALQLTTVECSELVGQQSVRGLLQFSPCEPLMLDAGSRYQ
jgi:hypothetical protein